MRKLAMGLAVGALALAMSAEAGACSYLPVPFTERPRDPSFADIWAQRSVPFLASLIRSSGFIDIAVLESLEARKQESRPQQYFVASFGLSESMRGGGGSFSINTIDDLRILGTGARQGDAGDFYLDYFRNSNFGFESQMAPVGHTSMDSCGGRVGVYLRPGWTYLIGHDGNGSANFIIPLADESPDMNSSAALEAHPWVIATRYALARPEDPAIRQLSLREYFSSHPGASIVEISDCRRPEITPTDQIGNGFDTLWLEWRAMSLTLEEFIEGDEAVRRMPEDEEAFWQAEFNAMDERRYDRLPFDGESCHERQRYLVTGYDLLFEIDENDMVDFTNFPSQLRILDAELVPLSAFRSWIERDTSE